MEVRRTADGGLGTMAVVVVVSDRRLFDGNQLTRKIPTTIGYVQTLEVIRLDRNALLSEVPLKLNNLTSRC
nr:probable leucine-rich repeat receptor-like protein kinase At5g49770 [Tanacetum cinerariifolium]